MFGNGVGTQASLAQRILAGPSEYLEAGAHTGRTFLPHPAVDQGDPGVGGGDREKGLKEEEGRKGAAACSCVVQQQPHLVKG